MSTHYTRYDSHPALFTLNLVSLVAVGLAPKLPVFHRLRFKFFDAGTTPGMLLSFPRPSSSRADFASFARSEPSAPPTPVEESMHAGERDFSRFSS